MGLHWGSSYLQALPPAIAAQIKWTETDPTIKLSHEQETIIPIYNGKTGEVIANVDAISTRRVSRSKLKKLLSQNLDIRYKKEIVSISATDCGVVATFADGEEAAGDVLVGCDSANSAVRSWLLGAEVARCEVLPCIAYNFTVQYTADQARWLRSQLHPLLKCAPHPQQDTWYIMPILEVKDPEDPASWIFQLFISLWTDAEAPATSEERLAHFKELAANYAEPFRSAAAWVPEGTYVPYDRIKHWPNPVRWNNHKGRVTLAGDAAHPMAPHRAQGLNNALQDAGHYVDMIKSVVSEGSRSGDRLESAVNAFDEEMFTRGAREIEVSYKQAYATMHWESYMNSPVVKHGHGSLNKQ